MKLGDFNRRQEDGEVKALVVGLLALFGASVIVGVILALIAFGRYCDEIAKYYGREQERNGHRGSDENVKNAFEREQYWNLMFGRHRSQGAPSTIKLGDRLSLGFRILFVASIGFVACFAILFGG
ncbi:MAG: hypothetical protein LCH73_15145 [Proteobacteria bacterium]|nr:hypothetical protein [Pseudomonadota bacterium]